MLEDQKMYHLLPHCRHYLLFQQLIKDEINLFRVQQFVVVLHPFVAHTLLLRHVHQGVVTGHRRVQQLLVLEALLHSMNQ